MPVRGHSSFFGLVCEVGVCVPPPRVDRRDLNGRDSPVNPGRGGMAQKQTSFPAADVIRGDAVNG
eukprot:CAMPEP_0119474882 /NCGR_PEP_ID=MMETSP1344-20130328/5965_1 /TAXON_ID=236787 /ORGANISM="Florenciella parvula, Strain CCMP2471" /LENGTH=64 /DNA_ID=CAMNT_0007508265 /DNA_START=170 /DNA_END=364 /DNA_ORIENTATION=-